MNELQIFEHEEFGSIRVVEVDGSPWFVGKDVAEKLGYSNLNEAISDHVDAEDKLNSKMLSSCAMHLGQRGGWLINESGLYSLVLSSKLPTAKQFKRWITSEVLPSIRKTGAYLVDSLLDNPDLAIEAFTKLKQERMQRLAVQNQLKVAQPKVFFADAVSASETSILVGELAKLLRQTGIEIGQNRLFAYLREQGYLMKRTSSYNLPTQKAMELGLFEVKETSIIHANGSVHISRTPMVTGKGQLYFMEKLAAQLAETHA